MKKTKLILWAAAFLVCSVLFAAAVGAANLTEAEAKAHSLKSLGLFRGVSDTDFDLGREPTRVEALVMLIRTLGKESEAVNGTWSHPFTDVPAWADPYVGYAYQTGLTKGVSETEFGSGNASAAMYVTFMLRALGYSDAEGDFTWDKPFALALKSGILPDSVDLERFLRADVVEVSYSALTAKLKNSETMLSDRLIEAGTFTRAELDEALGTPQLEHHHTTPREIFIMPVEPKPPVVTEAVEPAIGE